MSTEGKRPEEALTSSEQELRLLVEALPALVWSAGPEGNIEYVNKRVLEYLGALLGEVIGWGWMEKVHPDDVRVQGEDLARKSRVRKSSRCSLQTSRSGRPISVGRRTGGTPSPKQRPGCAGSSFGAGHRQTPSLALKPPSIEKSLPRQKPDSCPTRKETNAATSSTVPTRPIACDVPNPAIVSSMLLPSGAKERAESSSIGVRTEPGDTELTRTPSFAQSTAMALVSAWIAPLDVAYPSTLFWFICPCTEAKFTMAALPRAF